MSSALYRESFLAWVFRHSLLIAGACLCVIPLGSLLFTSLKEDDELYSGQVLPRLPVAPLRSPYVLAEAYPEPEPPPLLDQARWADLRVLLLGALARRCHELDAARASHPDGLIGKALARGLLHRLRARLPEDIGTRADSDIVGRYIELLRPADIEQVFDRCYRALRLGAVQLYDQDGRRHDPLSPQGRPGSVGAWRALGPGEIVPDHFSELPAVLVRYDLRGARELVLELAFALPLSAGQVHRLALPLRGEGSWYELDAEVRLGRDRYLARAPQILRSDRWLELFWQPPSLDDQAKEFKDYVVLEPLGRDQAAGEADATLRLVLRPAPAAVVAARKLSANYLDSFDRIPFFKYLGNSVLLVILNVLGALLSCSLVAYAFARLEWPGREACFFVLLATMMLPGQVTMVPVFLIYKWLGWQDTLRPLFVGSLFANGFFIFLLRQFMKSIPRDLEHAARIDGCGHLGVFRHVILPLIKPSLAAIAIFQFQSTWNDFMGPLIYLGSDRLYPLALGLFEFKTHYGGNYGLMMAASMMMTLPVMLVFFLAQRQFIEGVTLTGMKG